jgi:hypothetical protein
MSRKAQVDKERKLEVNLDGNARATGLKIQSP